MNDKPVKVQFVDPFTILCITERGAMRQIYTPFRVQCIQSAGTIPNNAWVYVDGVWQDKKDRLLYMIGGKLYAYHYFRLQILF